jgi:hypothetical protein
MGLREATGRAIGGVLAPAAWVASLTRGARVFHPDGVVYFAEVKALSCDGAVGDLAQRLEGTALARLSGGVWRYRGAKSEWLPDVLGVSLRFRSSLEISPLASTGDQDLLFLSFRYLPLLPLAMLTTNRRDFLANDYYAQLPFHVEGLGRVEFRLIPLRAASVEGDRRERLARAAAAGLAVLRLEVRKTGRPREWMPVVDIVLREQVEVDQQVLQFDPFRSGKGIVPVGLLQNVRLVTYAASYLGRTLAARGTPRK